MYPRALHDPAGSVSTCIHAIHRLVTEPSYGHIEFSFQGRGGGGGGEEDGYAP